jgi:hypothetical protein
MKTIRWVIVDDHEVEGMFSEDGELLGAWCLNDADWRQEYFSGFMETIGIEVIRDDSLALQQKLKNWFGIDD